MTTTRKIRKVFKSKPVTEGAGVHLKRVFGFSEVPLFDPFLMLDDFRAEKPEYYIKGFPWHPHRGIETITYVLSGDVEHGDSMGNKGIITSSEVQGTNYFDMKREPFLDKGTLILFGDGEEFFVSTEAEPARFLLMSGKPIGEPVAWYGPVVMNTQEELRVAFDEYREGTFVKHNV